MFSIKKCRITFVLAEVKLKALSEKNVYLFGYIFISYSFFGLFAFVVDIINDL